MGLVFDDPWINNPWVNLLIKEELNKIEPSLALQNEDRKILQICCMDFRNYSMYLEKSSVKSENLLFPTMEFDLNLKTGEWHFVGGKGKEVEEIVQFIQIWIKKWWKKYKQRVQVTVVKSPQFKFDKLANDGTVMIRKFSEEEINDIKVAVVQTLIKNDEICCTEILSDALFRRVLGRYAKNTEWTQEAKINLMSSLIREARRMSQTYGPLVFIRPDKDYYRLREFRDDGKTNLV